MKDTDFQFDRAAHRYTWKGRRVMSNTDALTLAGLTDYSFLDPAEREASLQRGTAVHDATYLYDNGKGWSHYSHLDGYVEAWARFCDAMKFKPSLREVPFYDPVLDCATCVDAFGESEVADGPITVQIKTGKIDHWVGIQTAFEERAIKIKMFQDARRKLESTDRRYAVELRADGVFVPRRFNQPGYKNDIQIFISALNLAKYKAAHGAKW